MFKNRCITIITSHVYLPTRTIAIADLEKYLELSPSAAERAEVEEWLHDLKEQ
jgi:hypothetical protein